jgi:hypothetical protein
VWIGASSLEAIEWAAERGHSVLLDPHSTHAEIAAKAAALRRGADGARSRSERRDIRSRARSRSRATTPARARPLRGAGWLLGSYERGASRPSVSANRRANLARSVGSTSMAA